LTYSGLSSAVVMVHRVVVLLITEPPRRSILAMRADPKGVAVLQAVVAFLE
jgi:hypothetical protein